MSNGTRSYAPRQRRGSSVVRAASVGSSVVPPVGEGPSVSAAVLVVGSSRGRLHSPSQKFALAVPDKAADFTGTKCRHQHLAFCSPSLALPLSLQLSRPSAKMISACTQQKAKRCDFAARRATAAAGAHGSATRAWEAATRARRQRRRRARASASGWQTSVKGCARYHAKLRLQLHLPTPRLLPRQEERLKSHDVDAEHNFAYHCSLMTNFYCSYILHYFTLLHVVEIHCENKSK